MRDEPFENIAGGGRQEAVNMKVKNMKNVYRIRIFISVGSDRRMIVGEYESPADGSVGCASHRGEAAAEA